MNHQVVTIFYKENESRFPQQEKKSNHCRAIERRDKKARTDALRLRP